MYIKPNSKQLSVELLSLHCNLDEDILKPTPGSYQEECVGFSNTGLWPMQRITVKKGRAKNSITYGFCNDNVRAAPWSNSLQQAEPTDLASRKSQD